jgi:electron transfer flavoprotein alpha subunit
MVLVFAESLNGQIKKTAQEAVTYGAKTAAVLGVPCVALTLGDAVAPTAGSLGVFGASRVLNVPNPALNHLDSGVYAQVIATVAQQMGATVVVVSHTSTGKSIAGRLAVRLGAGLVSGANTVPTSGAFQVSKSVYSGKAIATYEITSAIKVISVMGNAIKPEVLGADVTVEIAQVAVSASRVRVKSVTTQTGVVPLPEAEIVVSAGRGMKEPGNWGIVEDLAEVLGATTACSRPVSDTGWRPHHEHVGQTGIAIRPNLYIAIGISGAIQHLAGVNNSKTIVVINKDPEAPFFKAADYGIVGDLFEIVPKLTAAIKRLKA